VGKAVARRRRGDKSVHNTQSEASEVDVSEAKDTYESEKGRPIAVKITSRIQHQQSLCSSLSRVE